jgi:hypothetical protein
MSGFDGRRLQKTLAPTALRYSPRGPPKKNRKQPPEIRDGGYPEFANSMIKILGASQFRLPHPAFPIDGRKIFEKLL